MNGDVIPGSNFTIPAKGYVLLPPTEEPMYRQYKPAAKDIVPLPNAVLYMLMAVLVVVGVTYAIVGHLIKDLAIDLAECVLGPTGDEEKEKENNPQTMASSQPPAVHPFAYNAFHVWDQDGVVIALPLTESPQVSPMLLASIPYIPFLPAHAQPNESQLAGVIQQPGAGPGPQHLTVTGGAPPP